MTRTFEDDLKRELQDLESAKMFGAAQAKSSFAITLAEVRRQLNLTQQQLAAKLGVSQSYVAKLEGGEANPTLDRIGSLLAVLGLSLTTDTTRLSPYPDTLPPEIAPSKTPDMETYYAKIKRYEDNLHIHSSRYFDKQLALFDEMMELYLEPLDDLVDALPTKKGIGDPLIILLARIFNDFESSKLLVLRGYTEPAQMPLRDVIECMMLFRLFIYDSKLASRWMNDLKEYHPSNVKKRLDELEVDCPEYIYYGLLSQLTHPNLLSAMSIVTEKRLTNGLISRAFNFGGMNNPTWIGQIFIDIAILLFLNLQSILPLVYFNVLKRPNEWWDRVEGLKVRLVELGANIQIEEIELTDKEKEIRDQTLKKLGKLVHVKTTLFDKKKVAEDKGFPEL